MTGSALPGLSPGLATARRTFGIHRIKPGWRVYHRINRGANSCGLATRASVVADALVESNRRQSVNLADI